MKSSVIIDIEHRKTRSWKGKTNKVSTNELIDVE